MKDKLIQKWKFAGHSLIEYRYHWEALGKVFKTEDEAIKYIKMAVKAANSCA